MSNIIEFTGFDFNADRLSSNAARISVEENCQGSFVCYDQNRGVCCLPPDESLSTGRVLRRAAFEIGAKPVAPDPFFDDADHDDAFADHIPAPEDEITSIFLKYRINGTPDDKNDKIIEFCTVRKLDYSAEADGFSIFLNPITVLNLYFETGDDGEEVVIGELDASLLGAGVYVQAMRLSEELCAFVGGELVYLPDNFATYPVDHDFEKLRQLFYTYMRQQLAFAEADDLDGMQAYIGWSVDTFEPIEKPGSVITPYGRFNIGKLKEEVRVYGFEAVADYRLLFRNTPSMNVASDKIKVIHFFLWNDISEERIAMRALPGDSQKGIETNVILMMNEALEADSSFPILKRAYRRMLLAFDPGMILAQGLELAAHIETFPHYPVGYLNDTVKYGFGSYLRNFRLPGGMFVNEKIRGRYIVFDKFETEGKGADRRVWREHIRVMIDYSPDARINENFLRPEYSWTDCDIGGDTAVCRVGIRGDLEEFGVFSCLAVVQIRDEVYYFESLSDKRSLAEIFLNAITNCRAVEDVDDIIPFDHTDKPRAFGATFFVSGEASRPPFDEAFQQIAPLFTRCCQSIVTLNTRITQTTDISSKIGGTPYCPPGTVFPSCKGRRFDFICQLNFAEINAEKKFANLPIKGVLEFWTRDLDSLFAKPFTFLRARHPDIRVRWFPDPEGGYVTEPNGAALIAKSDTMLPTIADKMYDRIVEESSTILEGVARDYPDEFNNLFICRKNHIGGSPELIGAPAERFGDDASATIEFDDLLLQLEIPKKRGRMLFMIPPEALEKADFTCVKLIAYREVCAPGVGTISQVLHGICEGETLFEHIAQRLNSDPSLKSLHSAMRVDEEPDVEELPVFSEEDDFDLKDYDLGDDYGTERIPVSEKEPYTDDDMNADFQAFLRMIGIDPETLKRCVQDQKDEHTLLIYGHGDDGLEVYDTDEEPILSSGKVPQKSKPNVPKYIPPEKSKKDDPEKSVDSTNSDGDSSYDSADGTGDSTDPKNKEDNNG